MFDPENANLDLHFIFVRDFFKIHLMKRMRFIALLVQLALGSSEDTIPPASSKDLSALVSPLADKAEEPWTISRKFKLHLAEFIQATFSGECGLAVELGAHTGHTTTLLASLCHQVWALEASLAVLRSNMERNKKHRNIMFLEFHSVLDDWTKSLPVNEFVDFFLIDAAHDKASVVNDIRQASLRTKYLVLDDFGAEKGVREAVSQLVSEGLIRVLKFVGEEPGWMFMDRKVDDWEGAIVEVVNSEKAIFGENEIDKFSGNEIAQLVDTVWFVYPPGMFLTGNIPLKGKLRIADKGTLLEQGNLLGTMEETEAPFMNEKFEFRPEFDEEGSRAGFVFRGQSSGSRFQVEFRPTLQSGVMWDLGEKGGDKPWLLVAGSVVRTVGEKLLSTLY